MRTKRDSRGRIRMRFDPRPLIVGGMLIAAVINLVQFAGIDDDARHNYTALHAYDSSDIFEIAITQDNSARRWVGPFHYLGQLLPGSTVVVPLEGISSWFPFRTGVMTFGRAAEIIRMDYDPVELVDLEALEEHRLSVASYVPPRGATQRIIDERTSYYVSGRPSGTVVVITPEGRPGRQAPIAFVDAGLLDDDLSAQLGVR